MPLSFAQVQFALAFVTGIAPAKADAFNSRLKQWQKMGFPEGVNVGRGARAEYGATQLFQLAIMLKLMRVGLTPQRAQGVVLDAWPAFKDGIIEAIVCMANGEDHLHYCLVQLDALSELKDEYSDHMHVYVDIFTSDEIGLAFLEYDESATDEELQQQRVSNFFVKNRLAISVSIELDSMIAMLWIALDTAGIPDDVFADELAEWYQERQERGRAEQDSAHFDRDYSSVSAFTGPTEFDIRRAARAAISKVPAE